MRMLSNLCVHTCTCTVYVMMGERSSQALPPCAHFIMCDIVCAVKDHAHDGREPGNRAGDKGSLDFFPNWKSHMCVYMFM